MKRLIAALQESRGKRPFAWSGEPGRRGGNVHPPSQGRVLVLGPHPDDPESAAVTNRLLVRAGCEVWYAIVTMSPGGVEDDYAKGFEELWPLPDRDRKIEIRRREQRRSAELFGIGPERLSFLGVEEDEGGAVPDSLLNRARIEEHLERVAPDIVVLPVGNDTNRTHMWVSRAFRACAGDLARSLGRPIVALYNEDPKTTSMRDDLFVPFDEASAQWKRRLLRAHDSQQQRNIRTRGAGFDERILDMNRRAGQRLAETSSAEAHHAGYAEAFELELIEYFPA